MNVYERLLVFNERKLMTQKSSYFFRFLLVIVNPAPYEHPYINSIDDTDVIVHEHFYILY
jgi:hypothetical protein